MGLDYGINNYSGKISIDESYKIFLKAHSSGITTLDTAEAYGNAHQIIGFFHNKYPDLKFQIVSKVPHDFQKQSLKDRVFEYLKELKINFLEVLMFHSFESFLHSSHAIDDLIDLKSSGYINHIGVSVYTNRQMEYLLKEDCISVVQLPFNLLDNISVRGDLINKLKSRGVIIHTRSAFLQGLFFKDINDENNIVKKLYSELTILNRIALENNCSMEELALSYCLHQTCIDNVVIGVDSINHLGANINAALYTIREDTLRLINDIKVEDLDLLNPSLWEKK